MKKFKFELEPVLRVRRHQEEQQRQAFARVQKKKINLQEQLQRTYNRIEEYNQLINTKATGTDSAMGVARYQQQYSYLEEEHNRIWRLKQQIKEVQKELDKERKKLIEANKKVKILENLESKKRMLFLEEVDRLEQKQLNEVATQRYNWQRR